jgi:ubiquinone/menaquinone biosynthesis C-methylase UbiE
MRRTVIPELLDTDQGTPQEIASSLRDLGRINRLFGGVSTTERMLDRVAEATGRRELSLLDVASGDGELVVHARTRLANSGIRLGVTLLDRLESHLRQASSNGSTSKVVANALSLPFVDGSFDVVTCSLFLHHLEPNEVIRFAEEALRVCRAAVLINDLRRSLAHLAAAHAAFPLMRSSLSRYDGVASVRRAYTPGELRSILRDVTGRVEITNEFLFRMAAIVWKK